MGKSKGDCNKHQGNCYNTRFLVYHKINNFLMKLKTDVLSGSELFLTRVIQTEIILKRRWKVGSTGVRN